MNPDPTTILTTDATTDSAGRGASAADSTPDRGRRPRVTPSRIAVAAVAAGALVLGGYALGTRVVPVHHESMTVSQNEVTTRQGEIAARGAQVMPFDLNATTHVFDQTSDGGQQTVTADTPGDTSQIALIREHLRKEQAAFARGDFSDPASIHGRDMPGLAALQAGASRIKVTYTDVPQGGLMTYTTTDPALVTALHAWFRAQVSDHGSHAQMDH